MPTYTLAKLAELLDAELHAGDPATEISGIAPLAEAQAGQLSFLGLAKYAKFLPNTQAEVVLISPEYRDQCPVAALVVEQPAASFAQLAALFERRNEQMAGIHPAAVVGEGCDIDASASIGAHCVIGSRVRIGANTKLLPGTILADDICIGADCLLHARVTIYANVRIGDRVTLHSGAVIGSDGFGNANDQGRWLKTPQLGGVVIGDDADIGANTTIDCGALGDTIIGQGVKLDNLIQIAHNVEIGDHTAMAAQCGVAGSTKIGKYCMFAGQVGVNGHITICDHVIITASSGIMRSITEPGVYSSCMPIQPQSEWNRNLARFRKLNDFCKRLIKLEKVSKEVEHELN